VVTTGNIVKEQQMLPKALKGLAASYEKTVVQPDKL
jgi:hypothetical protein